MVVRELHVLRREWSAGGFKVGKGGEVKASVWLLSCNKSKQRGGTCRSHGPWRCVSCTCCGGGGRLVDSRLVKVGR
jgi:hypothetical protein